MHVRKQQPRALRQVLSVSILKLDIMQSASMEASMVAQNLIESHNQPTYQTIKLGRAILSVPIGVDLKPYIRQVLAIELESIQNPVAKAAIERGLNEATTDEDFSSLLETFHLLSAPANADRLIAALERSKSQETPPQSVDDLRRELGLVEETP